MTSFRKQNPPIGARPGTLAIPPDSPPPRIRVMAYGPEELEEREIPDVEELIAYRARPGVSWIDVQGLGDEALLLRLAEIFSIHPLSLEDAVNVPQRAKSEVRERHHVVVARMVLDGEDRIETPQVCLLIGPGYLITFQERYFGFFGPIRERIRAGIGPIRGAGADYLAYALLDALVDRYFPLAEEISGRLEDLEDEILEDPTPGCLARLHGLRRRVVVMRRVGWPQREAISNLMRDPSPFVSDTVRGFLRDTYGHIAQIMELVDSARDLAVGLLDIYLSTVSQRTNEIMKVLTLMASIFIPLTFVAGVYGMNFEFMPELHSPRAYPLVLLVMAGIAGGMVGFFWRRGWLGGRRRRNRGS